MACSFSPPLYQLFAFASMQLELLTTCIFTVYFVTTMLSFFVTGMFADYRITNPTGPNIVHDSWHAFSLPGELLCKTLHFANLLSGRKFAFWKCGKEFSSLISNQNSWCKHAFLYRFVYIFLYICIFVQICLQILYRFCFSGYCVSMCNLVVY